MRDRHPPVAQTRRNAKPGQARDDPRRDQKRIGNADMPHGRTPMSPAGVAPCPPFTSPSHIEQSNSRVQ